jgi:hypothetical protein
LGARGHTAAVVHTLLGTAELNGIIPQRCALAERGQHYDVHRSNQHSQQRDAMSEEFEVRGAYEDRMEEAADREPRGMAGQLAVITAILATVGAAFSYMAGATQADAGLLKNDAAIRKTEASNQWNFYQAKSNKQNLSELGTQLVDEKRRPAFEAEAKRYSLEKVDIKLAAEKLEKESTDFDAQSEAKMHQHHRWAQATTLLQIAIAMAAIALLTKRRWLEKAVFALSAIGLVVGTLAYFHI